MSFLKVTQFTGRSVRPLFKKPTTGNVIFREPKRERKEELLFNHYVVQKNFLKDRATSVIIFAFNSIHYFVFIVK